MLLVYALFCFVQEKLTLKARQEEVLTNLYDGRDVFAWFSTGYSKLLCYQLLPFLLDFELKRTYYPRVKRSVVIVNLSLVSLMVNQVSSLLHSAVWWVPLKKLWIINIITRVIERVCALLPLQCVPGLIFRASILHASRCICEKYSAGDEARGETTQAKAPSFEIGKKIQTLNCI